MAYILFNPEKEFPTVSQMRKIDGLQLVNVHTAIEGEYQFLLGAAIIKHRGTLYCSFGNSLRQENDSHSRLSQKKSYDGGKTWVEYASISQKEPIYGKSHGVYFEHENELYAFCPRAKFSPTSYPELQMEGYKLKKENEWEYLGIVLNEDFWPMCEPVRLDNGSLVMAGLKTDDHSPAVALCDGKNLKNWQMRPIPIPKDLWIWGETALLKYDDTLLAIVRGGPETGYAWVSESHDNGETWTEIVESNFYVVHSKMYAGTLKNGEKYLAFTAKKDGYRDSLCIAVGRQTFERVYLIRHGFDAPPKFQPANEWCYPYAYEDRDENKLYVVYAKNKEDCELAIIPLESITE